MSSKKISFHAEVLDFFKCHSHKESLNVGHWVPGVEAPLNPRWAGTKAAACENSVEKDGKSRFSATILGYRIYP